MQKAFFLFFLCLCCSSNAQGTSAISPTVDLIVSAETAPIELKNFASDDLFWAYNTLMSVEDNALLLAQNNQETQLLRSVQSSKNIKKSVQIIPSDKEATLFKQLKINSLEELQTRNQSIFLTLTIENSLKEKIKHKSYLTGLALKMTTTPFDNLAVLKRNVEQTFLLDYLSVSLLPMTEEKKEATYSGTTYFAPLSMLYRHYKNSNEEAQSENIKRLLDNIAQQTNSQVYLSEILNESLGKTSLKSSILTPKGLEKGMIKINEKLYASEVETTNAQYNLFLQDLLQQREYEKIALCKINPTDWKKLMTEEQKKLEENILFPWGKPESDRFPVQNISYEAAVLYCEWVTNAYNSNPSTKKKYKKVVFRLPSEKEWEVAVRGNKPETTLYSWLSTSNAVSATDYRTVKGCFLSNFNVEDARYNCATCKKSIDAKYSKDGAYFTVFTDAYYPTDLGLFNTSGNVAEMVAEKGKAKGGSWEDIPENCTIKSVKTYNEPSPAIGFRVFMEIIE